MDRKEMTARLLAELRRVGGAGYRVGTPDAARRQIVRILTAGQVRRVIRDASSRLDELDPDAALDAAGIEVVACDRPGLRETAFDADAGLTAVDFGVAETGTLALGARPGQERTVSLLPPIHVALLAARDLVWDLGELFARVAAEGSLPSALTLITGPSCTGDIELSLTVGVHGPREVHLILLED